jgi:glycosyltransferase involved in cell wall biosynthesis
MVIFHLIVGLEVSGAELMLFRLVSALPKHKNIIISLTSIGPVGNRLIDAGQTVHTLDLRLLTFCHSLYKLWRLIRAYRPDVIQTWMYHSDLLGGILGRLAGVRNIVWNVRNTEIPQGAWSLTGIVVRLCAVFSHFIPRVIVCCAYAGLERHASLGYCRDRMVVIPNGYETQNLQEVLQSKFSVRAMYGISQTAFVVGIVGRFDRLKGFDIFIETAGLMVDRCPSELLFIMSGRSLDEKNTTLSALIQNKGRQAQFKLMGEQKDVAEIMVALDVLCMASRSEGFPNVVAEAMLMQIPCVVTDVGDARIIVGQTGRVVLPGKPDVLADALLEIESMNEIQRRQMGHDARERIVMNYDIKIISQSYAEIYDWKDKE